MILVEQNANNWEKIEKEIVALEEKKAENCTNEFI